MKKLILHVGMPKTGTTAIQRTLMDYDKDGVRLPRLAGQSNHSVLLAALYAEDPATVPNFAKRGLSGKALSTQLAKYREAFSKALSAPADTLVISAEGLVNFDAAQVAAILRDISDAGREVHLVAYVRDPISLAGSNLQQNLKAFGRRPNRLLPQNYEAKLGPWLAAVPAERRTVRPLDRAVLKGGSVVADFADLCGMDLAGRPEQNLNESMTDGVTRALWIFSGAMAVSHGRPRLLMARNGFLRDLNENLTGEKFATPVAAMQDDAKLRGMVRWLRDATGIDYMPKVDAVADQMGQRTLDDEMSRLSPETDGQLRDLAKARGLPVTKRSTPAEILAHLYLDRLAPETQASSGLNRLLGSRLLSALRSRNG